MAHDTDVRGQLGQHRPQQPLPRIRNTPAPGPAPPGDPPLTHWQTPFLQDFGAGQSVRGARESSRCKQPVNGRKIGTYMSADQPGGSCGHGCKQVLLRARTQARQCIHTLTGAVALRRAEAGVRAVCVAVRAFAVGVALCTVFVCSNKPRCTSHAHICQQHSVG